MTPRGNYAFGFIFWIVTIFHTTWAGTWYNWGQWNECSRSCDGGISSRQRLCYGDRCNGHSSEYKLCNVQGCLTNDNLPEYEACQIYGKQSQDRGYRWAPRQTYQCSVFCAEESRRLPDLVSVNFPDGIKCSKRPNHYCIGGNCMHLGCDGVVGSSKRLDDCGACDGGGSSCKTSTPGVKSPYQWKSKWSFCSVSCGTGFETVRITCVNVRYSQTVPDYFCDFSDKPSTNIRECSSSPCEPRWKMSHWLECSVKCGGGVQKREVTCVHMPGRSRNVVLPDYRCPDPIPPSEQPCNTQFCPSAWQSGIWSECSVSCGVGVQNRPVYCMKSFIRGININVSDSECFGPKPSVSRPCSQSPCFRMISFAPKIKKDNATFIQLKKSKTIRLKVGVTATLLPRQTVKMECPVEHFDKSLLFWTKNNRLISTSIFNRVYVTSKGALKIKRTDPSMDKGIYTCIAGMEKGSVNLDFQSKRSARQKAKKIKKSILQKSKNEILNKPQSDTVPGSGPQGIIALSSNTKHSKKTGIFMTSDWSKCSRTCGVGFQTRKVTCSIVTDKFLKIVTDNHCDDKKPENYRICTDNPYCPIWQTGNWTECSVNSCIYDGIAEQRRNIICVAENNQTKKLPVKRCNQESRPENARQCHNEQCESIWRTSKWSSCKPRCARKGKKTRMLSCVWKHTKKSATYNCKSNAKPELWRFCRPKHCIRNCMDTSRYCSLTKLLRLCRYGAFREKCCATCSNSVLT